MIRVLHIWNSAGIAGYLSKYMKNIFNVRSLVMMRKVQDPFKLSNRYVKVLDCGFKEFVARCWLRGHWFDIIHIHGEDKILKIFKQTSIYRDKPIIIHYHGSDIRNKWDEKRPFWKCADKIIVSTPDLLEGSPDGVEYLPNVIDERLCSRYIVRCPDMASGFHVCHGAVFEAYEYARKLGIDLSTFYAPVEGVCHEDFIKRLSEYDYYFDIKKRNDKILKATSLTGLEALYMGHNVVRYDGEVIYGFPSEHLLVNVCSRLNDIYEDLMK